MFGSGDGCRKRGDSCVSGCHASLSWPAGPGSRAGFARAAAHSAAGRWPPSPRRRWRCRSRTPSRSAGAKLGAIRARMTPEGMVTHTGPTYRCHPSPTHVGGCGGRSRWRGLPATPARRLHGEKGEAEDQNPGYYFARAPGTAGTHRARLVPFGPGGSPGRCGRTEAGSHNGADRRIPGRGGPVQAARGSAGHSLCDGPNPARACRCREHRPVRGCGTGGYRRQHRRRAGGDEYTGRAAQEADGSKAHDHFTANHSR